MREVCGATASTLGHCTTPKTTLGDFLARIPDLQAKSKARNQAATGRKATEFACITAAVGVQLPLWANSLRCLPNEIFRSALFTARNRRQPRTHYKKAVEIAVIGEGRITYKGEELRQDDETVWLQLIHLAKEYSLGQFVEFTPYSFCKAIGWPICKASYPIKLDTIKTGAGMTTERPAKVRELIERALNELVNVKFLADWDIKGELVHVKRAPRT